MESARVRDRKRIRGRNFAAFVLCIASWLPTEALAQSSSTSDAYARRAAAEALFDEAKALMAAQRYSEACSKFAASQAMDPAVGTRLNLADCFEKVGRTASAWAEFRAAATAARAKGQTDRAEIARKRAATLETMLVRLSVAAPTGSNEKLEIRRNGAILERGSWGVALPVDPGHHVIEASIAGKRVFHTEVDVPNKPGTQVTTIIPTLEDAVSSRRQVQRGVAISLGAIGVASFIAGGILGAQAVGRNSQSTAHCTRGNLCDETGVALRQDALAFGNASTALFVVGAAASAGAFVVYLTTPPKIPPTNIGFGAIHSGVGLIVGGAF
jgi:hypothetical protein